MLAARAAANYHVSGANRSGIRRVGRAGPLEDIVALLLLLGVVLAIVAIVGHGIWVLVAAAFGRGSAKRRASLTQDHSASGRRACPRCLTPIESVAATCHVCGWPRPVGERNDPQAGLAAVRRQKTTACVGRDELG